MEDIRNREDIQLLVDTFYQQALMDETIGYIFTEVALLNFEKHMPVMYDFWESILLGKKVYKGNVMVKHMELDKKETLQKEHFKRWLSLWTKTVNDLFKGEKAEEAIRRAQLMEQGFTVISKKSPQPNFVWLR